MTIAVAAAAPLLTAPSVKADQSECMKDLGQVTDKYQPVMQHLDSKDRRGVSSMKSAAVYLASVDRDDACEEVVEALNDLMTERESGLVTQGVLQPADERARQQRLEQAASKIGQHQALRARDVIGADVRNLQDEDLGDVEDVIVNPADGTASHLLVATGGFLGMGEDIVAVPVGKVGFTDAMDVVLVNMPEDAFEKAPKITEENINSPDQAAWRQETQSYFDQNTPK
ncbi:MAG: PRC-barrel domain-containing protein [Rhodospirillales bacterium]|nr:PRC-barrel domain-containing protein [Rhodospirillales bacterium]